jgi:hypothetical protein
MATKTDTGAKYLLPFSSQKKGGRQRKVPAAQPSAFEQLDDRMRDMRARNRVIFDSDDMDLVSRIADATHGKRGALVRQHARKKHVTEHTIWKRIPEIERLNEAYDSATAPLTSSIQQILTMLLIRQ